MATLCAPSQADAFTDTIPENPAGMRQCIGFALLRQINAAPTPM